MAANLECAHRQGSHQNTASGGSHAAKPYRRRHENETITSDHGKLDNGQRDRIVEFAEDGFASV